jgi:exosome complex component RRP42
MSNENILDLLESQKAKELLLNSKRMDERDLKEIRNLEIKTGVIPSADGSAHLKLGNTEILAGVKFAVGNPYVDSPEDGAMILNLELSAISGPDFETGPPRIESVEFGRVADRAIRSSECIDFSKLCIVSGEHVLLAFVDCYVLNADGNLIDAAQYAAMSALLNTKIPKLNEDNKIIYDEYTSSKIPIDLSKFPASFTFYKVGNRIILDATHAEELASDCRFSIGVVGNNIVSYHKGGTGTFTSLEIKEMMKLALEKYDFIKTKICDIK